jgi:effector-binding domain-containing protein
VPGTPAVTDRGEQPYVAIRMPVTMQTISAAADRIREVFGWLAARGVAPAWPPFLRYNVIDMARQLEIEAGVPVAAPVAAGGEVRSGVLPSGRYASVIHVGPPAGLVGATATLLTWAAEHGLSFDMSAGPEGERWGCRLEIYLTDPREQPDVSAWETQLAFRLAD